MTPEFLAQVLRLARERSGLTQDALAQKCGVTRKRVEHWERGLGLETASVFFTALFALSPTAGELNGTGRSVGTETVNPDRIRLPRAARMSARVGFDSSVMDCAEYMSPHRSGYRLIRGWNLIRADGDDA